VTIVEFADFQCPYCRRMAPVLREVLQKYPRDVRLVYRQLPLIDLHPNSLHAAEASLCALEQGKFWEMHDAMFADQDALDVDGLKRTAAQVQLRAQPFADCLASDRTLAVIRADTKAATDLGVNGTPGLFINGRFVSGAVSYEEMAATIEDELRRAQSQGSRVASRSP
jgi:protein-disulfide isomerase